jgi:hypothetical protein
MPSTPLKTTATVLICTYNRADLLAETLDSLALSRTTFRWNVIVVDNNSTDQTGSAVTSRAASYPVKLIYLFEPRQGKSNALNTGLAATDAEIIIFTDDDVRVGEGWVEASCRAMLDDPTIDYTGGPVLPIWEQPRPPWLHEHRSDLWGTLAILDYGPQVFIFEDRQRVPLGANMAVRRRLIDRIGGFDPKLGRTGKSLLGQEQAEFFCRPGAAPDPRIFPAVVVLEGRLAIAARPASHGHGARRQSRHRTSNRRRPALPVRLGRPRRDGVAAGARDARPRGTHAARNDAVLLRWLRERHVDGSPPFGRKCRAASGLPVSSTSP